MTKLDLPDQVLSGLIDVDGDGVAELACTATHGSLIPERSTLSVIGFKGGNPVTRWRESEAEFQVQPMARMPENVNTNGSTGTVDVLAVATKNQAHPLFITHKQVDSSSGLVELSAWQADVMGQISRPGRVTGPHLECWGAILPRAQRVKF